MLIIERTFRREQVAAASSTLQAIFDSSNVLELAVLLLEHFLILRQSELEAWEEDPEEWVLEVAGEVVSAESGLRVGFVNICLTLGCWGSSVYGTSIKLQGRHAQIHCSFNPKDTE
jgi:hypothetical protein